MYNTHKATWKHINLFLRPGNSWSQNMKFTHRIRAKIGSRCVTGRIQQLCFSAKRDHSFSKRHYIKTTWNIFKAWNTTLLQTLKWWTTIFSFVKTSATETEWKHAFKAIIFLLDWRTNFEQQHCFGETQLVCGATHSENINQNSFVHFSRDFQTT